jgi:hypothetical protein
VGVGVECGLESAEQGETGESVVGDGVRWVDGVILGNEGGAVVFEHTDDAGKVLGSAPRGQVDGGCAREVDGGGPPCGMPVVVY